MSGIATIASIITAVTAAGGAYMAYEQGKEQKAAAQRANELQRAANQQAKAESEKRLAQADQEFNKHNQKRPNTNALLGAVAQQAKAGASGTLLTGTQGIDPNSLTLGKNTLLGQ